MKQLNGAAGAFGDQSDQVVEGECFRAYCVAYRVSRLNDRVGQQLGHVFDIDRTYAVAAVAGDGKGGKATHEPRDVVDENVFGAEDHGGAENGVREARVDQSLLDFSFAFVVSER